MDISVLSLGELQKLRIRIEKEIEGRNNKQRGQALVEIQSIVAKYGLKLEDVIRSSAVRKTHSKIAKVKGKFGKRSATKSVKKAAVIQYRHPENTELTWAGGRGRRPQWIKDWEASGRTLDEARVVNG